MNIPTGLFYKKILRTNAQTVLEDCNFLIKSEEEDCDDDLEDTVTANEASQNEPLPQVLLEALGE